MPDILRMSVTRDKLYEEVWAEPMAKVAVRYRISANYLARVCHHLNFHFRIAATGPSGSSGRRRPVYRCLPGARVK